MGSDGRGQGGGKAGQKKKFQQFALREFFGDGRLREFSFDHSLAHALRVNARAVIGHDDE